EQQTAGARGLLPTLPGGLGNRHLTWRASVSRRPFGELSLTVVDPVNGFSFGKCSRLLELLLGVSDFQRLPRIDRLHRGSRAECVRALVGMFAGVEQLQPDAESQPGARCLRRQADRSAQM